MIGQSELVNVSLLICSVSARALAVTSLGCFSSVLAPAAEMGGTTTASGKLIFGIFAALAEFEGDLIRERTMAGLAAARARGRHGGRKFELSKNQIRLARSGMANRDKLLQKGKDVPIRGGQV